MVKLIVLCIALAATAASAPSTGREALSDRQTLGSGNLLQLQHCPGYTASNIKQTATALTADLKLAGVACNVYGKDIKSLALTVTYETGRTNNFVPTGS
jgi:hypothetical protein